MNRSFYEQLGINLNEDTKNVYIDAPMNKLVEKAVLLGQGHLSKQGALVVKTGKHTGRSAQDRYIVKSETTQDKVWWDNALTAMTPETFATLKEMAIEHINKGENLFITERSVGAHKEHNVGARLITNYPQHALFSKYLFRPTQRDMSERDFTILHCPEMKIDHEKLGLRSETVIVTCFDTRTTIIIGTLYAGEIKKSMFSVMNYELPDTGILPMHSGASRLTNGETSVFFGLSGTGKTTLSADEGTFLIGDDEHGLSDEGIFNFEGGCYAKTYKLTRQGEPEIYEASNRFGSMLENVVITDKTGEPDFFDKSISENGRSSYPLDFIKELEKSAQGKIPQHIFFLSADAFGVLPPVAKLTKEQAMFYFVLGYTAKLAGTEIGVKEPQATFSTLFGAPFMLRHPEVYAKLLGEYLDRHDINVWMINTGWTGGAYGEGQRFPLNVTRNIIRTIQSNELNRVATNKDEIFGLETPVAVRNVPTSFLEPKDNWKDPAAFAVKAKELAQSFHDQMKNFGEYYQKNIEGSPIYGRN